MQESIEYHQSLVKDAKRLAKARKSWQIALNETTKPCDDARWYELKGVERLRLIEYEAIKNELGFERVIECERMMAANKRRWMRVRSGVKHLLEQDAALFVTLTFTDECLSSTSPATRRKYVRRYLASQTDDYMANRDFGGQTGREHYHALVRAASIDLQPWQEAHGRINVKRIKTKGTSTAEEHRATIGRISRYIDKLTNHALKDGADDRIIWSRKRPALSESNLEEVEDIDEFIEWLTAGLDKPQKT